ncbi:uncharacterized protein Z518_00839 [Rhinocladiella mackenziei CBS 650.93]|uniref:Uncharacterized protein n=1 Tax=Rhinocladiella mackenziei CBS 650.93 TaxID=1442369 RepID=A0A0D2HGE9_9EURO|nr:uncharacterized protein Z518_00839 [Rhinocladiella mackenziei CBS 650.93]KIX09758.1 hypothetical protein Z518_00839 [Rhinocladiella mackenziei CBS 650.93]
MPTSSRGRRAPDAATDPLEEGEKTKCEAPLLSAETISVSADQHHDPTQDDGGPDLLGLAQLITDLKEVILQQSSIIADQNGGIEKVQTELAEVKAEQRALQSQNLELQEEVRSLRSQIDAYSHIGPFLCRCGTNPAEQRARQFDTSRVVGEDAEKVSVGAIRTNVEKDMRNTSEQTNWRCRAVTKDQKNPRRVRIACRNEAEHKEVKRVMEANLVTGMRVLRDDLSHQSGRCQPHGSP